MSSPVCDRCGSWIEVDNRAFPGYCSTDCRQHARAERDRASAALAQRRADRRQQAAAHQPVKSYVT